MKITLPFEIDPTMKTYVSNAYPLGMIEGYFGKSFIPRLFCDKYISCLYNAIDRNMFYLYERDSWFEELGLLSRESYVCEVADYKCVPEAVEEAGKRLSEGEFVFAFVNEGRLHAVNHGTPYDFTHECLICGYDDVTKTFDAVGYIDGIYTAFQIEYDEYIDSLVNIRGGFVELLFYRVNKDFIMPPLDIDNVIFGLKEYIGSTCCYFVNQENLREYISSGKLKFGISVWDELANYISSIPDRQNRIDMRYMRIFMDGKYLMHLRLDYLVKSGFLSDEKQYALISENSYNSAKTLMMLAIKYNITKEESLLRRIYDKIKEINLTEYDILSNAIRELEENREKKT